MKYKINFSLQLNSLKKVGCGNLTKFWCDLWIGDSTLKSRYARLFSISTQKEDLVAQMGYWQNHRWYWRFNWRRNLFSWEQNMIQDLLNDINQHSFIEGLDDALLWKFDSSGIFSVKSFSLQVIRDTISSMSVLPQVSLVWKNLAPLRVELLVWFILMERLSTKDRLIRYNCTSVNDPTCVLCSDGVESVRHLFFTCSATWALWYNCFQWWGVIWCCPNDPISFFKAWEGTPFSGFERKLWISLIYVVLWTIWRVRNRVIF